MKKFDNLNKRYIGAINTDIISDGSRFFVVDNHKWNGENWSDCFEIAPNLIDIISEKNYTITPIYQQINEDDFKITDYSIQ